MLDDGPRSRGDNRRRRVPRLGNYTDPFVDPLPSRSGTGTPHSFLGNDGFVTHESTTGRDRRFANNAVYEVGEYLGRAGRCMKRTAEGRTELLKDLKSDSLTDYRFF